MIIRDGASSVEITFREVGAIGTPSAADVGIDVAVTAGATRVGGPFSGRNNSVWIGRDLWTRFLSDLRELDRIRWGQAHMAAMSPAEFQLIIRATDRAGHLAAEGWVGRQYSGSEAAAYDRVWFSLQIEPSTLPQLVSAFQALAPAG